MTVSSEIDVIVATFGDDHWRVLAERAAESVRNQTVKCGLHLIHGRTLAEARNLGAERAEAPYLVFLDADDVLHPTFIEKMSASIEGCRDKQVLLQSEVSYVKPGAPPDPPRFLRAQPILLSNYLLVGTGIARETFIGVGGFRELDLLEDWDLWIRCIASGCRVRKVYGAVYEVRLRAGSRNDAGKRRISQMVRELRVRYWPAIYGRAHSPLSPLRLLLDDLGFAFKWRRS